MRARKVDATQHGIVQALESAGCLVWTVNAELDLVVQKLGRTYLLECKTGAKGLTEAQERMKSEGWHYLIVRTPEQALEAVGVTYGPQLAVPSPSTRPSRQTDNPDGRRRPQGTGDRVPVTKRSP